jgi:hypothetical protein
MDAAEDFAALLDAMSDDPAMAVRTNRRERVDRAFEAIKGVLLASDDHLKRLVIVIFANFAFRHTKFFACRRPFGGVLLIFASENCSA